MSTETAASNAVRGEKMPSGDDQEMLEELQDRFEAASETD